MTPTNPAGGSSASAITASLKNLRAIPAHAEENLRALKAHRPRGTANEMGVWLDKSTNAARQNNLTIFVDSLSHAVTLAAEIAPTRVSLLNTRNDIMTVLAAIADGASDLRTLPMHR